MNQVPDASASAQAIRIVSPITGQTYEVWFYAIQHQDREPIEILHYGLVESAA